MRLDLDLALAALAGPASPGADEPPFPSAGDSVD